MIKRVFKAIKPVHIMVFISGVSTAVSTFTCYRLSEPKTSVTVSYPKGFLEKVDEIVDGLKLICSTNAAINGYNYDEGSDYNVFKNCEDWFKKIKTSKN